MPPDVLAAREPTLVAATPADLQLVRQWRAQGRNTSFQITSVPLSEMHASDLERYSALPIDKLRYDALEDADAFLDPQDPVIAFASGPEARAFPLRILVWHEVVNSVVGDQPVLATYDPRTNVTAVFERRLLGAAMRFHAADALHRGGRLLWDSLTQSWWRQLTGEAIVGDLTGMRLRPLPTLLVSFAEFRQEFPQGRVLDPASRPEGDDTSDYGASKYPGYDGRSDPPEFFDGVPDPRLPPKARVLALNLHDEAAAFDFDHLASKRALNVEVGGRPVVAFWSPGALSVLDTPQIADARDVGMAAAHGREVDGRALTLEFADGAFRDRETESAWSLSGHARSGPLAGAQLPALVHSSPFWFAWAAHHPQTRLVTSPT